MVTKVIGKVDGKEVVFERAEGVLVEHHRSLLI